jgi:hypothetical protein
VVWSFETLKIIRWSVTTVGFSVGTKHPPHAFASPSTIVTAVVISTAVIAVSASFLPLRI